MAFRKIVKDSKGGQRYVTEQEEELEFDQVPTEGSFNPVTSDGVAKGIEEASDNITKLIPEGTTEENQIVNEAGLAKAAGSVQDKGALTDGASVEVTNNAVQTLSTSRSTITVNVTPEGGQSPNFALEITPSQDLTITVTKTVGNTVTNLYPSNAGGNVADAGGYYQLTCVGNCWTLAQFTVPETP